VSVRDWSVWGFDGPTIWVILWMLQFFAIEYLTSGASPIVSWRGQMVTDHWRPLVHAAPITWWIGFGVLRWLDLHFLWPAGEAMLKRFVGQ
jgi:hypothetical protein